MQFCKGNPAFPVSKFPKFSSSPPVEGKIRKIYQLFTDISPPVGGKSLKFPPSSLSDFGGKNHRFPPQTFRSGGDFPDLDRSPPCGGETVFLLPLGGSDLGGGKDFFPSGVRIQGGMKITAPPKTSDLGGEAESHNFLIPLLGYQKSSYGQCTRRRRKIFTILRSEMEFS